MRRKTRLLTVCAGRVIALALLLLVVVLLSGCVQPDEVVPVPATAKPLVSPPTVTPRPTPTPLPTALDFPLPAPTHQTVGEQGYETCVQCHADEAMLKGSIAPEQETASGSETGAWAGELPPEERWRAVYLDDLAFLETMHGRYGCITCHGGMGNTLLKEVAHTGLIRQPGSTDLCADCHSQEVSHAENNLHASLTGYRTILFARTSAANTSVLETVLAEHCDSCHTATCGQCHVSQPAGIGGGLVAGHDFGDIEAINSTCAGCHGSRVEAEYKNLDGSGQGDVHWTQARMVCSDCHLASSFHGSPGDHLNRYDGPPVPSCDDLGCHPDVADGDGIEQHAGSHLKSLSCQACHATSYRNCYGCHVQAGDESAGFTLDSTQMALQIGRNPIQSGYRPWKYVPVRHVPIVEDSFSDYGEDLLNNFDALPTWKYATPHTIQRITPQNESCDACHDNTDLFLTADDVPPEMLRANWPVIVERVIGPVD